MREEWNLIRGENVLHYSTIQLRFITSVCVRTILHYLVLLVETIHLYHCEIFYCFCNILWVAYSDSSCTCVLVFMDNNFKPLLNRCVIYETLIFKITGQESVWIINFCTANFITKSNVIQSQVNLTKLDFDW